MSFCHGYLQLYQIDKIRGETNASQKKKKTRMQHTFPSWVHKQSSRKLETFSGISRKETTVSHSWEESEISECIGHVGRSALALSFPPKYLDSLCGYQVQRWLWYRKKTLWGYFIHKGQLSTSLVAMTRTNQNLAFYDMISPVNASYQTSQITITGWWFSTNTKCSDGLGEELTHNFQENIIRRGKKARQIFRFA